MERLTMKTVTNNEFKYMTWSQQKEVLKQEKEHKQTVATVNKIKKVVYVLGFVFLAWALLYAGTMDFNALTGK